MFVFGRQFMDRYLLANSCIDARLKEGKGEVVCKIDMEKAYDHVNWSFLDFMLHQMAFGKNGEIG